MNVWYFHSAGRVLNIARLKRFIRSVPNRLTKGKRVKIATAAVLAFPRLQDKRCHGLPGELIISLTSYPRRFSVLGFTVRSLLDQTVRPDRVVLWIAEQDIDQVPADVKALSQYGLEIRSCEDIRSFKKIVPTLREWPHAYIVTADDDIYYESSWLESLIDSYDVNHPRILCRRAHRVVRGANGRMRPYQHWDWQIVDPRPSYCDIFPTGCDGVMYYPGALSEETTNSAVFMDLCPSADDVWLFWMGRLKGAEYQQVGGYSRPLEWPQSQVGALYSLNTSLNDRQIEAMQNYYGPV